MCDFWGESSGSGGGSDSSYGMVEEVAVAAVTVVLAAMAVE